MILNSVLSHSSLIQDQAISRSSPHVPAAGVAQPVCDAAAHGSFVKVMNNSLTSCGSVYFQRVSVGLFLVIALSTHTFNFFA